MTCAAPDAHWGAALDALRRYEACLKTLVDCRALPLVQVGGARGCGAAAWPWFRDALLSGPAPDAAVFLRRGERIGVADLDTLRRTLILRSLYARRSAVRRCIARTQLERMRAALGVEAFDALVDWAGSDGETVLPLPASLAPRALAQDGLWRLRREDTLRSAALAQLIQCRLDGLPSDPPQPPAADDLPSAAEGERFITRLLSLIPTLS
ncbi:type III secretion protein HrpB4 [Paraburkholderia humisilvae]|uniref:Type III secretion protein HrpB4 n=1 Tax=Paraburkholderia humisilvae TaxID=627669 RepID=A0A6J5F064_9BURK|nr:type III secretion protein HrpB4 [Paraburkholderia humisilvae]CAB3772218.1 hypothetical protein LMG29542_06831 [Paraburkholderia humisilvae]